MRALALAALLLGSPASAHQVHVFAAASLKDALDEIVALWEAQTETDAIVTYAGTPQLARQIAEGAPADLFLSASTAWVDDLGTQGLVAGREDILGNRLVLIAHGDAQPVEIGPDLDLPALLGPDGKLAMAFVDSVPAGIYGREALTTLGLWDAVEPQVAQTENVRAALALVASGEAPLGIVYASDAVAAQAAGEDVAVLGTFPAETHTPITYTAALVSDSEHGRELLIFFASPEAQAVWSSQGFAVPN